MRLNPDDLWRDRTRLTAVGLMAGTSLDGLDVAIVQFYRDAGRLPQVRAFETFAFPPELRSAIETCVSIGKGDIELLASLHWAFGQFSAHCVRELAKKQKIDLKDVAFIASHGLTVRHFPEAAPMGQWPVHGTFQIGEPAVIAAETDCLTVSDFRAADIAVGGQGAPLLPFFDYAFFRDARQARCLLNIGGITNMTFIPADAAPQDVVATDCGPGNMLLNALTRRLFQKPFDANGELAARGTVANGLLDWLLDHPFIRKPTPKTAGREQFGEAFVNRLLQKAESMRLNPVDILATATYFSAQAVADELKRLSPTPMVTLWISGGGRKNRTLIRFLKERLPEADIYDFDETGLSADAKEAVGFAYLGLCLLQGERLWLPRATGARKPALLGKISFP